MLVYALLLQRRAGYVDLAVRSAVQCTLLSEPRSDAVSLHMRRSSTALPHAASSTAEHKTPRAAESKEILEHHFWRADLLMLIKIHMFAFASLHEDPLMMVVVVMMMMMMMNFLIFTRFFFTRSNDDDDDDDNAWWWWDIYLRYEERLIMMRWWWWWWNRRIAFGQIRCMVISSNMHVMNALFFARGACLSYDAFHSFVIPFTIVLLFQFVSFLCKKCMFAVKCISQVSTSILRS